MANLQQHRQYFKLEGAKQVILKISQIYRKSIKEQFEVRYQWIYTYFRHLKNMELVKEPKGEAIARKSGNL
jgi:hypothetical protein